MHCKLCTHSFSRAQNLTFRKDILELKGSMVGWYKSLCVAGLMWNTGYGYILLSAAVQLLIVHYCPVWLVPLLPLISVTQKGYLGACYPHVTPMGLDSSVIPWQCHGSSVLLPTTSSGPPPALRNWRGQYSVRTFWETLDVCKAEPLKSWCPS